MILFGSLRQQQQLSNEGAYEEWERSVEKGGGPREGEKGTVCFCDCYAIGMLE